MSTLFALIMTPVVMVVFLLWLDEDIRLPQRKKYITVDGIRYLVGKVADWQNVYNLEHEVLDKPLGWHVEDGSHHGIETKCQKCLNWQRTESQKMRKMAGMYMSMPAVARATARFNKDPEYLAWEKWTARYGDKNPNQAPPIPTRRSSNRGFA